MQVRIAIALALSIALFASGWYLGGLSGRLASAQQSLAQSRQDMQVVAKAQQDAAKANKALQDELRKPKLAPKTKEAIRANPSTCRVPGPVDDGLRRQIREANRAARG